MIDSSSPVLVIRGVALLELDLLRLLAISVRARWVPVRFS